MQSKTLDSADWKLSI